MNIGERPVHLVGTVPLPDARQVFQTVCPMLGPLLKRIPDGETGDRQWWIFGKIRKIHDHPMLEPDGHDWTPDSGIIPVKPPKYRIKASADPGSLTFENLGFADAAGKSYAEFLTQRKAEKIPADCKFQVGLPTPISFSAAMISLESQAAVEAALERRMLTELSEIAESIPHRDLAIQWDVCLEIFIWEGREAALADPRADTVARLVRLGDAVPRDIALGYHLCYGDFNHKHSVQPKDTAIMVEMANAVTAGVSRQIDWIHMPVPRDRDDDAYFAPLQNLALQPETELYLGLLHMTDGLDGAKRRMATARKYASEFGIATECGFGRRSPEAVPELLRLHAEAARI